MNNEPSCKHQHNEFETCGIFFRPMTLDAVGDTIDGHTHFFDHAMVCLEGEADITGRWPDGSLAFSAHIKAKEVYPVQKGICHEIRATVAPYSHFCVFPSRLPAGGHIAGENTGWVPSSI